jgi:hypothetical protein
MSSGRHSGAAADDLSPQRSPSQPETLDLTIAGFDDLDAEQLRLQLRKRGYVVVLERVGARGSIYRISGVAGCGERLITQGDAAADRDVEPTPEAGEAA